MFSSGSGGLHGREVKTKGTVSGQSHKVKLFVLLIFIGYLN